MLIKKPDDAAKMFLEYIEEHGLDELTRDHSYAFMFLANYYLTRVNYDQAFHYAQKCLNYAETKEEAKALLKTIMCERLHMDVNHTMWMSMNDKHSKVMDYDREMPRQLQMLSLTQKTETHQKQAHEDDDDDDNDDESDEERLCNKITMYIDL